jgi:hypothetical protein
VGATLLDEHARGVGLRAEGLDRPKEVVRALVLRGHRLHDLGDVSFVGGEREHGLDLDDHAVDTLAVRLVHHEDVGDLHDPRLQCLDLVAEPGHEDHDAHVGRAHDLHLVLADPYRLHEHHVLAGGGEHGDDVPRGRGEAAEVPARSHRADEDAVVESVGLHTDAVAQDRAPAERRRRVDGHDANGAPLGAEVRGHAIDERRLARSRRPRHPDHERLPRVREERGEEGGSLRPVVLHQADRARHGAHVAAEDVADEGGGRGRGHGSKQRLLTALLTAMLSGGSPLRGQHAAAGPSGALEVGNGGIANRKR